jgi:dTDP-4-dehydrorhamnose reductase
MNSKSEEEEENFTKTILIFGISSFVGSNLAEYFKRTYKVIGTYNKNPARIPGVLTLSCDVLNKDEVQLIVYAFKPDITIYCAGLASVFECHKYEALADALNTSGLFNVQEYCQRYQSQIVYISSAYVFAGEKKNYIEMDIPDASTLYGKSQAAAEFFLQKSSLNYCIFRVCRLYGRGVAYANPTWLENLERKIKLGQPISMDNYIHTGFMDVYYLALIMKMAFEKKAQNRLFQVTSRDVHSLYEFGREYAEVFQHSKDMIAKGKWYFPLSQTQTSTQISGDELYFKLDSMNIEGFLNITMPSMRESLELTFNRLHGVTKKSQNESGGEGVIFI